MTLGEKESFARNMKFKSVIMVGETFIDFKSSIGYSFLNDPDGYLFVEFVYPSGTTMQVRLEDRNEFCKFLIQTEMFMDDVGKTMPNMMDYVKRIEKKYKFEKADREFHINCTEEQLDQMLRDKLDDDE
jgi:hypothetical protein